MTPNARTLKQTTNLYPTAASSLPHVFQGMLPQCTPGRRQRPTGFQETRITPPGLSNFEQNSGKPACIHPRMGTNSILLCIHRNPAQLRLLKENGYELVTARNGHDGLRLFMSRPVDAIVLEYHLSVLDGSVIAARIKQVRPTVPIVMLTDHLELPDGALKSVDALVTKSDGVHFLMATVHFLLCVRPARSRKKSLGGQTTIHLRHPGRPRGGAAALPANAARAAMHEMDVPPSPGVWRSIRNGKIQF